MYDCRDRDIRLGCCRHRRRPIAFAISFCFNLESHYFCLTFNFVSVFTLSHSNGNMVTHCALCRFIFALCVSVHGFACSHVALNWAILLSQLLTTTKQTFIFLLHVALLSLSVQAFVSLHVGMPPFCDWRWWFRWIVLHFHPSISFPSTLAQAHLNLKLSVSYVALSMIIRFRDLYELRIAN